MISDMQHLQWLITRTAEAGTTFNRMQDDLMDFCREKYGCEPGDIDADEIIDSVLGGSGECPGMDAAQFDKIMRAGRAR